MSQKVNSTLEKKYEPDALQRERLTVLYRKCAIYANLMLRRLLSSKYSAILLNLPTL